MTSDHQPEALAALAEVWALAPDIRLGQLFAHLGFLGEAHHGRGLGYIDDDEFLSVIRKHRDELLARQNSTVQHSAGVCVGSESETSHRA